MGKRYNSAVGYYRRVYGERLQKLVIDAGFSCPNRDGTLSTGGCTFCDNAAFHPGYSVPGKSITEQIDEGIEFHKVRYRGAGHYLAYFQSYSNTYAPLPRLREVYEEALSHPDIVGIAIGTRPDCVDDEKLDYLDSLSRGEVLRGWTRGLGAAGSEQSVALTAPIVSVEYGIESCYDSTLSSINRGHDFATARWAVEETARRGLPVCGHFILGLPGETRGMLLDQCSLINALPLHSIKFHQLQLIRGTRMETQFDEHPESFLRLELSDYVDLIVDILERLRPDLCIERVAGEVPPRFVRQTQWGLVRNFQILHLLDDRLAQRDTFQGRLRYSL